MDIKEMISDTVERVVKMLKEDKSLLKRFKEEPIKVLEEILDIDLPDEKIEEVITLIKAKLAADKVEDTVDDIKDALGIRKNYSNKGTYGYIALIGGSTRYSGAIRLAYLANAAMRSRIANTAKKS